MEKKKIVIADDEDDIISALKETLAGYYTVYSASNGKEAVELAQKITPDVMILDIMMPEMDGYEACRKLKHARETAAIPVLILTVKNQVTDTQKAFDCGADAYMTKPFSPGKLLDKLGKLVEQAEIRKGI
jgi:CheY-like chemotaxis protein